MSSPERKLRHSSADVAVVLRLEEAKRAGASRARRIQLPCLLLGVFAAVRLVVISRLAPEEAYSTSIALVQVAVAVVLLGALPNQTRVIRGLAVGGTLLCALSVAVAALRASRVWLNLTGHAETPGIAEEPPLRTAMALAAFHFLATVVGSCPPMWLMARHLLRRSPGLVLLQVLWKCLAFESAWSGFVLCLDLLVRVLSEQSDAFNGPWTTGAAALLLLTVGGVASRPEFRAACQAWLARRGGREDAAAGLAALIGGLPADRVLEAAQRNFRCVRLEHVLDGDMAESRPNASLRDLSEPAVLGEVDAFLTHSWHDNAEEKWAALQGWRVRFCEEHGREPRVWIDKYCIDQQNIEESLVGLPVFLAGCKQLVVFPGSTYASRLWCAIELLTFITMGGKVADIVIVPFQSFVMDWSSFDVSGASCDDPRETARLLAVLEGFSGTRARFNKMVRELFAQPMGKVATVPGSSQPTGKGTEVGTLHSDRVRRSYV